MAVAIYRVRCRADEDRPYFLAKRLTHVRCNDDSWDVNLTICCRRPGEALPDLEAWVHCDFLCQEPGWPEATDWDYYACGSTTGLFSQRAIDALCPCFGGRLVPMAATFEGEPYYFLAVCEFLNCLDRGACDIEYYPPPIDDMIRDIRRYVFHKERLNDPLLFVIPEMRPWLFATESVPAIVEAHGLKGFEFVLVDGPPSPSIDPK